MSHLSSAEAIGWTGAGAGTAGLVMGAMFKLQRMFGGAAAPQSPSGERDRLLAESGWHGGECDSAETPVVQSGGLLATSFIVAVPSVLGVWCWPVLFVGLFGASSSILNSENRERSHHFTFGADLLLFGGIVWWTASAAAVSRAEPLWRRWGPVLLVAVGCLLLLWDPTRHLLLDHGFPPEKLAMFDEDGHLSPMGRFSQLCSVFGFVFLFSGLLWFLGALDRLFKPHMRRE